MRVVASIVSMEGILQGSEAGVQKGHSGDLVIDLTNRRASDADLSTLVAKYGKRIRVLKLRHARVTDTGLKALRELTELQVLELTGTSITDRGIANLTKLSKLQELRLNGTKVSDA